MNYIEFEIGGKLRGFKFGVGFLGDILEFLDTDIVGLGKSISKNPFKATPAILFFGHKRECERKGVPVTFTLDDVNDWIEELKGGLNNENITQCGIIIVNELRKHLSHLTNEEDTGEKKN